ncbi:MAG: hypothetical protein CBB80_005105 [Synechococcus sp. TMED20]|nr:MAG: hypothetical protein CBB80_005105 [Synechococcus sp. TMED20]
MLKPSLNGDGKDKLEGDAGADRFYFSGKSPSPRAKPIKWWISAPKKAIKSSLQIKFSSIQLSPTPFYKT